MKKILFLTSILSLLLVSTVPSSAEARSRFSLSVNNNVYAAPRPVVVERYYQPVYAAPQAYYAAPQPYYVQEVAPEVVYVRPARPVYPVAVYQRPVRPAVNTSFGFHWFFGL